MARLRKDIQKAHGREASGPIELSCLYCRIIRGLEPEPENFSSDNKIASWTPPNPVIPGHLIFVPCVHIQDAAESPLWAGIVFMAAADWATSRRNEFNLITCAGEWAHQDVRHLSIHYIPRIPLDKLQLPW